MPVLTRTRLARVALYATTQDTSCSSTRIGDSSSDRSQPDASPVPSVEPVVPRSAAAGLEPLQVFVGHEWGSGAVALGHSQRT